MLHHSQKTALTIGEHPIIHIFEDFSKKKKNNNKKHTEITIEWNREHENTCAPTTNNYRKLDTRYASFMMMFRTLSQQMMFALIILFLFDNSEHYFSHTFSPWIIEQILILSHFSCFGTQIRHNSSSNFRWQRRIRRSIGVSKAVQIVSTLMIWTNLLRQTTTTQIWITDFQLIIGNESILHSQTHTICLFIDVIFPMRLSLTRTTTTTHTKKRSKFYLTLYNTIRTTVSLKIHLEIE